SSRRMGEGRDLSGLRKNGDTFPLEISLSFLTHDESKLVVAFITDISTRKRQEQALKESRKKLEEYATELESKVKERTRELEHLNLGLQSQIRERKLAEEALKDSLAELKKAEEEILDSLEKQKEVNELKSRFISMASHEFRTPLTTIQSSADLIGKYQNTDQQPKREKHITRIKGAVHNLTNILNDYLSLEKLESGVVKVNNQTFSLKKLLSDCLEAFELGLKTSQNINLLNKAEVDHITSDQHILKNVLMNLISNAIKYSEDDIDIIINKVEENIVLIVKDRGIGIPDKEQQMLFERFFRAENVVNIQGNGLGLNIVLRYMDLIGGSISFESTEGIGSEFSISFPART
ncbi:MAG: ATP-binding protein, partial [Cyclobacteriaceae bacterium]